MAELGLEEFGDEKELSGFSPVKSGNYHFVVLEADDSFSKSDAIVLDCEVLAGTVPGQEGKKLKAYFNNGKSSDKDGGKFLRKRQARLALVLGLISPADLGKRVNVDFTQAAGRQFCAAVEQGEKYAEIRGLDFWSVTAPEAAEIPKDAAALAMIGVTPQNGSAAGAPQASPAAPLNPSPVAAQAPATDPFAGL